MEEVEGNGLKYGVSLRNKKKSRNFQGEKKTEKRKALQLEVS